MASVLRRAELSAAAAQKLVIASGLAAGIICTLAFLGPDSPASDGVVSAPLFVYGLLVGALVPGVVELLRMLRVKVPTPPLGLRWRAVEIDLAILAAVSAAGLVVIEQDGMLGVLAGLIGAAGLLLGTQRLAE